MNGDVPADETGLIANFAWNSIRVQFRRGARVRGRRGARDRALQGQWRLDN